MLIKNTIKTEAYFNDEKSFRFYLKKVWNPKKTVPVVIMSSSGDCDGVSLDYSTMFSTNALQKLDYGGIEVLNLVPKIGKFTIDDLELYKKELEENDALILDKVKSAEQVILAIGRGFKTNKAMKIQEERIMEIIKDYKDKVLVLCHKDGRRGFHPLSIKNNDWNLQHLE